MIPGVLVSWALAGGSSSVRVEPDLNGITRAVERADCTAAGYRSEGELTSVTTAYSYDRLYRLTGADDGSPRGYGYDPAGNRSSKDATGYSYDRADRVTSAGGVSYSVNGNGNLVSRGADSFGYDQANRLKTCQPSSGITSGYVYDGDGKRASKTVGGTRPPTSAT